MTASMPWVPFWKLVYWGRSDTKQFCMTSLSQKQLSGCYNFPPLALLYALIKVCTFSVKCFCMLYRLRYKIYLSHELKHKSFEWLSLPQYFLYCKSRTNSPLYAWIDECAHVSILHPWVEARTCSCSMIVLQYDSVCYHFVGNFCFETGSCVIQAGLKPGTSGPLAFASRLLGSQMYAPTSSLWCAADGN